jgi:hypothetical protein
MCVPAAGGAAGPPGIPRNIIEGATMRRLAIGGTAASPSAGRNASVRPHHQPATFVPAAGGAAGPPGIPRNIIEGATIRRIPIRRTAASPSAGTNAFVRPHHQATTLVLAACDAAGPPEDSDKKTGAKVILD